MVNKPMLPEKPSIVSLNPIRWTSEPTTVATDLWDLKLLDVPHVWSHYGVRGEGVNVFIIDSGIDARHSAFAHHPNIVTRSFLPGVNNSMDGTGHGTWVAGKIAGMGVGIAPRVNLTCLRVFDESGTGTSEFTTKALQWILDNVSTPHLINMSLGGMTPNESQKEVIGQLSDKGALVVAAMGNYGSSEPMYPAGFDRLLAVGAVNKNKELASFSNYGANVDIVAPGVACYSTYLDKKFRAMDGTSMSTPIVTGMLALGMSFLIQHKFDVVSIRGAVFTALQQTATDLGARGRDDKFGWGMVNGSKFMANLHELVK